MTVQRYCFFSTHSEDTQKKKQKKLSVTKIEFSVTKINLPVTKIEISMTKIEIPVCVKARL